MVRPSDFTFSYGYNAASKLGDLVGYEIKIYHAILFDRTIRFVTYDGINWITLDHTNAPQNRFLPEIFTAGSNLQQVIDVFEQYDHQVLQIIRDGTVVYQATYGGSDEDSDWSDGYDPADDADIFDNGDDYDDGWSSGYLGDDPNNDPDGGDDHPPSVVNGY